MFVLKLGTKCWTGLQEFHPVKVYTIIIADTCIDVGLSKPTVRQRADTATSTLPPVVPPWTHLLASVVAGVVMCSVVVAVFLLFVLHRHTSATNRPHVVTGQLSFSCAEN